ncbi:hypothetical protein GGI43DRAFT_381847 [Trichoderma evansii]
MAPKLRTKPNIRARVQRAPTKFSELDITPSRPGENHHPPSKDGKDTDESYHYDHDIGDPLFDETQDITNTASFAWSDAGSTNVTHRSTPAPPDDVPTEEFWDFDDEDDEAIEQLFSQDPKNKNLPDTVPLKEPSLTPGPQVDFSETASTIRRSSPFLTSDAQRDIWDFSDSLSGNEAPTDAKSVQKEKPYLNSGSQHIAIDDIYDATPRKEVAPVQELATAAPNIKVSKTTSVTQNHSATAITSSKFETTGQPSSRSSAKNKKHQQKAKEPIQFDPVTQEIVDVPVSKKKNPPPKRSIVSALQESAKGSSSPFVSAKKAPRKQAPKQNQPKTKPAKKRKRKAEVAQHDSPSIDILNDSPVQIVMAGSAEVSPDLRSVDHEDDAMENQPPCIEDISDSKQKQNEHLHQKPLASNEANIGLKPLPIERDQPKRRKLSRQFSISEKGSPVVTRDAAPTKRAVPNIIELDPFIMESTNPAVAVQRPSFLRTVSGDKLYGQQSDNAVGSIDKIPSRWLRRVDENKPCPKDNSTGRNIHDNIMKSFLQDAEPVKGPQDRRLDEMTGHGQIHKQICLTVDQLMIHLDEKKAAASKMVEAYHAGGTASIAHMQQQCLYDCQKVVTTFRRHGAPFDKNLQAAKDTIQARRRARTRIAGELDELLKSRNQAYGRVRSNLGAAV